MANTRGSYNGYQVVNSRTGVWSDLHMMQDHIQIYRTTVITPYALDVTASQLSDALQDDLGRFFRGDEVRLLSHEDCDKRAYLRSNGQYRYNLFGCIGSQDWLADRWQIIMLTHAPFLGFV